MDTHGPKKAGKTSQGKGSTRELKEPAGPCHEARYFRDTQEIVQSPRGGNNLVTFQKSVMPALKCLML
jgi:hypothetical protein